jgi:hypothetical protein
MRIGSASDRSLYAAAVEPDRELTADLTVLAQFQEHHRGLRCSLGSVDDY